MMTGAAIPFLASSLREVPWSDDWQELAAAIAGNPAAWVWANGLFLAAAMLTTLGLVAFSIRFNGPSRSWAWMGLVAFAFAAVLEVVARIISVGPATWAAQQGLDATDVTVQAFIRLDEGLGVAFFILGFLSLTLYGVAMTQTEGPSGIGWAFVAGGILGIVLELAWGTIPAFVYFGTAALAMTTWRLGVTAPTRRRAAGQET